LPGARFRIENVATQGASAVTEVVAALRRLDEDPTIDVIVIARGGGSVEDLLPFSNETLIRAVAAAGTPVVSAIGHETDVPLLDHVADLAVSTPTDAAKRIVPDLAEELAVTTELRRRARACIRQRLHRESEVMAGLPERLRRSVRAQLDGASAEVGRWRERARRRLGGQLEAGHAELAHVVARLRTLSPQATLERGYAVVRRPDGTVVRDAAEAGPSVRVRVARGEFEATVA
jgi:exodeoxyribonuclease VII large subunit